MIEWVPVLIITAHNGGAAIAESRASRTRSYASGRVGPARVGLSIPGGVSPLRPGALLHAAPPRPKGGCRGSARDPIRPAS